jgi:protein TonB
VGYRFLARRPPPVTRTTFAAAPEGQPPVPTPTFLPEFLETPAAPTNAMSEAQFQDEVSKRLSVEVQKLEAQMRARPAPRGAGSAPELPVSRRPPAAAAPPATAPASDETAAAPASRALEPTAVPAAPTAAPASAEASAMPVAPPTAAALHEGMLIALEDADTPPRIAKIVKPSYPPLALQARIGGIVVLRVLVSERGAPLTIEVVRGAAAGLTEAAVDAVRKWTFDPARKGGLAMRTWMTIPIPFEP